MKVKDILFPQIALSPEDGGGGGAAVETPAAEDGDQPETILTKQDEGDQGADATKGDQDDRQSKDSSGDKPDDGDEPEKGNETENGSDQIALTAPAEYSEYQEQFDSFAAEMNPWLKENPQATPQDILNEVANRQAKLVSEQKSGAIEAHAAKVKSWETEVRSDKDMGGDNFDKNMATAAKAVDTFGSPELKQILNETGLGSNPHLIKAFLNAGKALEEAPVLKGTAPQGDLSLADALYPNKN